MATSPMQAGTPAPTDQAAMDMVIASPGFADWLPDVGVSVALTTCKTGWLFPVGRKP